MPHPFKGARPADGAMTPRRAWTALLLLVAASAYVAAPAAAFSGCGGPYTIAAQCTFTCGDPKLSVWADASNPGAVAWVQVQAQCGIAVGGTFTSIYSVGCSAIGPGYAACSNSVATPALWLSVPLTGVCTVNGQMVGNWNCLAS